MALVTMNGLGIQLRGKAGSAVFAATKNGIVLRPHTVPRNPRTPAQTAARARMARAASAWATLAPEEHAAWVAYGRTLSRTPLARSSQ